MRFHLAQIFIGLLLVAASSAGQQAGHPYDFGVHLSTFTRRQDAVYPRIVVTGAPVLNNQSLPYRMEVREMKLDTYKWDLLVLALSMFQYVSQDDPLSWYQISAVHGVPFQEWNGVPPVPGGEYSGYCPHSSSMFPMWHRAYLALYEQELYRLANLIAGMYKNSGERALYLKAASDFRIPYWNWAESTAYGQTHFPDVFWDPVISQNGPNGRQMIRNPLHSYAFHPMNEEAFIWAPLKFWSETKRAPDMSINALDPPSRNDQVNNALAAKLPEIQQRLYNLFSGYKDFNSFGNKAWAVSQNNSAYDSIEAVHDIVHIYGGLKGHMTYVPLSSYDPIFFMHHAMTDRLIMMWQILNPDAWMTPMAAGETTWTALNGTIQDSKTPLSPFFRNQDGTFWNSDDIRGTEPLGYTYADTDPALAAASNYQGVLAAKITQWFGRASPMALLLSGSQSSFGMATHSRHARDRRFPGYVLNVKPEAPSPAVESIIHDGKYTEWVANVYNNVEALDGRFSVHFFVGDAPLDTKRWEEAPNHLGAVNIFAMDRNTGSDSKISGTLPLTSGLMKLVAARELRGLRPEHVMPLIQHGITFKVLGSDDREVAPEGVAGLYIGVSSSEVKVPESDHSLPQWGPMKERVVLWSRAGYA